MGSLKDTFNAGRKAAKKDAIIQFVLRGHRPEEIAKRFEIPLDVAKALYDAAKPKSENEQER